MEELTLDTDHMVPELTIGTVQGHPTVQGPTVQGHPTVHLMIGPTVRLIGQIHSGDQALMN